MDEFVKWQPSFADELYSEHHQCDNCGRITKGPGKEERNAIPRYGPHLNHIDENGTGYTYDEAPEKPYNVSTGRCPNCFESLHRGAARDTNWRVKLREWSKRPAAQHEQEMLDEGVTNEYAMRAEGARREYAMNEESARRQAEFEAENAARELPAGDETNGL